MLILAGVVIVVVAVVPVVAVLVCALRFRSKGGRATPACPLDLDVKAAVERLAEAIRFPTVSAQDAAAADPRPFRDLRDFLELAYPNVHRTLVREVVNGSSLLYTWKGTDPARKPILLLAHLDVVPVESSTEGAWTHPPFSGAVAAGFIWGRGTLDNKSSVMGILESVEHLLIAGFRPARTVYLAFGHDEERGGAQGAAQISSVLQARGVTAEFLVDEGLAVGEGLIPDVARPVAMIGTAEKGLLTLELRVRGASGHASMPPKSTAAGTLARAIHRLEAHPMPMRMVAPVRGLLDVAGRHMPFARRVVFANLWLFERLVLQRLALAPATNAAIRTTTAVTVLRAGEKDNALPTEARALVNLRILPGESVAKVTECVRRTVSDPEVAVTPILAIEPSALASTRSPGYRVLAETIGEVFPDATVAPGLMVAGTDSRHYLPVAELAYRFVPLRLTREDLSRIHGVNERISVASYTEVITFYVRLVTNAAG